MLNFSKTAVHPFTPERTVNGDYRIFTPYQIELLAGQSVTIDFLVGVHLPVGYRGELKLRPTGGPKLLLHSQPIGDCIIQLNSPLSPSHVSLSLTAWWSSEAAHNLVAIFHNFGDRSISLLRGEAHVEFTVAQVWKGPVRGARDLSEWFSAYETVQREKQAADSYSTAQEYHPTPIPPPPPPPPPPPQQQQRPIGVVTPFNWRSPPTPPSPHAPETSRYQLWGDRGVSCRRELFPLQHAAAAGEITPPLQFRQPMEEGDSSDDAVSIERLLAAAIGDEQTLAPLSTPSPPGGRRTVYENISP